MLQNNTPGQIKKIHVLVSVLGIDEMIFTGKCYNRFNTASSKGLANFQADSLIEELEEKAVQCGVWKKIAPFKQKNEALDGRPGFASAAQLVLIESTWAKVSKMKRRN